MQEVKKLLHHRMVLEAYVNENIWPMYTQITSQAVSYDYGTGSVMGLDGVLGVHKADLDGDTLPELLVIRVQSGQILWDIYRVNNSAVELASTTIPCTNGLGQAMSDMSYEMSQTCFLKDQGGSFIIGIASNYSNVEEGQGTPSVRTSLETYSISGGTCSMLMQLRSLTDQRYILIMTVEQLRKVEAIPLCPRLHLQDLAEAGLRKAPVYWIPWIL